MTVIHARSIALIVSLLATASCGGLLGGGSPADLYRFGDAPPAAPPQQAETGPPVVVSYGGADFEAESRGDRILTVSGTTMSYVADARWVAPAEELFDGALLRSLDGLAPAIRVVRSGQLPRTDFTLIVDVRRFEAVYTAPETPEAVIEASVRLVRRADRRIVGEWPVSTRQPAGENRVTAIVAAFDRATSAVAARINDFTRETVASVPAQAPATGTP